MSETEYAVCEKCAHFWPYDAHLGEEAAPTKCENCGADTVEIGYDAEHAEWESQAILEIGGNR